VIGLQGAGEERGATYNTEMMQAAHVLNGPSFAHAILTTLRLVKKDPALGRHSAVMVGAGQP
jgi:hypothetical protein